MLITARFTPRSMTQAQYEEVHRRLDAMGLGAPDGRMFHVCYGTGDHLGVLDLWESAEKFAAFGQRLLPVLAEVGVDPGLPDVQPVNRVIEMSPLLDA
jgi:hypothetical protein